MHSVPDSYVPPRQYDLFSSFYGQEQDKYCNTIELWDAIPKFSAGVAAEAHLRRTGQALDLFEHEFMWHKMPKAQHHPLKCTVTVAPSKLRIDGKVVERYPGPTEEAVEEILRKIFLEQTFGYHLIQQVIDGRMVDVSYVRFTTNLIRKRLKEAGKTRSHKEIVDALQVMNGSMIKVYMSGRKGKALYSSSILPVIATVDREDYISNPDTYWKVQLSPLITEAINSGAYRQYDHVVQIRMVSALARFLQKKLNHEYTNADWSTTYAIKYSTIKRDTALLHNHKISANLTLCRKAFNELKKNSILTGWTENIERGAKNKIMDVRFELQPHLPFITHMKASNKRHADVQLELNNLAH